MRRDIQRILQSRGIVTEEAVREYIQLLRDTRDEIERSIRLAQGWEARHLTAIKNSLSEVITNYTSKNINLQTEGNSKLWEFGQEIVDVPLAKIGFAPQFGTLSDSQLLALNIVRNEHFVELSSEMLNKINAAVTRGVVGKLSPYQTMQEIDGILQSEGFRAERVMRTELGRSMNTAAQLRMKESKQFVPQLQKMWLTAFERVRFSHQPMNKQIRDVDEKFDMYNPRTGAIEKLDYPLDPEVSAELVVNCRCTSVPYVEGKY